MALKDTMSRSATRPEFILTNEKRDELEKLFLEIDKYLDNILTKNGVQVQVGGNIKSFLGRYYYKQKVIVIYQNQILSSQKVTLIHEIVHAIDGILNYKDPLGFGYNKHGHDAWFWFKFGQLFQLFCPNKIVTNDIPHILEEE